LVCLDEEMGTGYGFGVQGESGRVRGKRVRGTGFGVQGKSGRVLGSGYRVQGMRGLNPHGSETPRSATIREVLLRPHRCYLNPVWPVLGEVLAIAHITGGGLVDNIPARSTRGVFRADIHASSWTEPPHFRGCCGRRGLRTTRCGTCSNLGVGMVLVGGTGRPPNGVISSLRSAGETAWVLGEVVAGDRTVRFSWTDGASRSPQRARRVKNDAPGLGYRQVAVSRIRQDRAHRFPWKWLRGNTVSSWLAHGRTRKHKPGVV